MERTLKLLDEAIEVAKKTLKDLQDANKLLNDKIKRDIPTSSGTGIIGNSK